MSKRNCPSRNELSGYALGTLPPTAADEVTEHIAECSACEDTLQSLSPTSDSLIASIQAPATPERFVQEPACVKVVSQLEGNSPAEKGPNTVGATPAPSASNSSSERARAMNHNEFVDFVTTTELVSNDELTAITKGRPSAETTDVQTLAKLLVQQEKLTKYQAAAIYQGKGKTLFYGDYLVLDRIGAGGMGQVFKARHRRMDRIVALKVMSAAAIKSADAVKRFEREVRAAAKLTHPNIVHAYDAGLQDGARYLVMEYVEGNDLSQLLRQHAKFGVKQACGFIEQAARGFAAAHAKGVVHRDVKPGNLLLDKSGVVKVLDMGLARFDDEGIGGAMSEGELTQTGSVMGTVDYMAPEQALDTRHADAKSDVYGLGCTLFRVVTGEPVYQGRTLVEKILAHRDHPIPMVRKFRPDAPAALDQLLARMLAKSPKDRPTMQEVADGLASIDFTNTKAGGLDIPLAPISTGLPTATVQAPIGHAPMPNVGGPTVRPRTAGAAPPRKKSILPLLAAAGAGGLLILGGVWVYIKDKDGKNVAVVEVPEGGSVQMATTAPPIAPPPVAAATPSATRTNPPPMFEANTTTPTVASVPTTPVTPPTTTPGGTDSPNTPTPTSSDASPVICTKLIARREPVGLSPDAIHFAGPPIDRYGANGFAIKAPADWRTAGTAWTFDYRCNQWDNGIQMIHPIAGGHMRMVLMTNFLGLAPGGPWGIEGIMKYYLPKERKLEPLASTVFPLNNTDTYRVKSVCDAAGNYTLSINDQVIVKQQVGPVSPQQMKPPFEDPKCPDVIAVGDAALIIGPAASPGAGVTIFNEANDVRLTTAGPALVASASPASSTTLPTVSDPNVRMIDPAIERRAAQRIQEIGGTFSYTTPDGPNVTVKPADPIPTDPFAIIGINLNHKNATDKDLEAFVGLGNVKEMTVYKATVTDAGLRSIAALTTMERMQLPGDTMQFTDAGLQVLGSLTRLGWLDLNGSKITAAGAAALHKKLPQCNILFLPHGELPGSPIPKVSEKIVFRTGSSTPTAVATTQNPDAAPDPTLVCTTLAAKAKPVGLAADGIAFDGPNGDGRRGANGIFLPAPTDWRTSGTLWSFNYRSLNNIGVIMIHPFAGGHFRVVVRQDGADIIPGGPWASHGGHTYGFSGKYPMVKTADTATIFPLQQDVAYALTSRVDQGGNYQLLVNDKLVYSGQVVPTAPLGMKPPFEDPRCPDVVAAGYAGLIIGPRDGGTNEATQIHLRSNARVQRPRTTTAIASVATAGGSPSVPADWTPLIPLIESGRDTQDATWKVTGETAQFGASGKRASVWFPYPLGNDYDAYVYIKITRSKETTALTLPVGDANYVVLDLKGDSGNSEATTATAKLNGIKPEPTAVGDAKLNIGTEYRFTARVRVAKPNVRVEIDRDGQQLFRWTGTTDDLTGKSTTFRPKTMQLDTAYYTTSEIRELRVRAIGSTSATTAVVSVTPTSAAPAAVTPAAERAAAIAVLSKQGKIKISIDGKDSNMLSSPQELPTGPFQVVEVSFYNIKTTTDADLAPLRHMPAVRDVNLLNTQITDAGLEHLKDLKELGSLNLSDTYVRGPGIRYLSDLPKLLRLITGDHSIDDSAAPLLRRLEPLEKFEAVRSQLSDLSWIEPLPNITGLHVGGSRVFDISKLRTKTKITNLNLWRTFIIDRDLEALQDLKELDSLNIVETDISDAGLRYLEGLTKLKKLNVKDTFITEAGAARLRAKLPGCQITDVATKSGSPPSQRRTPPPALIVDIPASASSTSTVASALPSFAPPPTETASTERKPAPVAADQQAALKNIKEIFADDYSAAKTPDQKSALATKLLDQARQTNDDATSRFVLLNEARTLATDAGVLEPLSEAMRLQLAEFDLDPVSTRLDAWNALLKRPRIDSFTIQQLTKEATTLFDQAIVDADFDDAKRYGDFTVTTTRRLANPAATIKLLTERNTALAARQKEWPTLVATAEKLKANPADPEANLAIARYLSLAAEDWPGAFPLYAKAGDPQFAELGAKSLKALDDNSVQVATGDAWWDAAQAAKPPLKQELLGGANYWYTTAVPLLSGLPKTRIEKRIAEMAPQIPTKKIFASTLPSFSDGPVKIDNSGAVPFDPRAMPNKTFGEPSGSSPSQPATPAAGVATGSRQIAQSLLSVGGTLKVRLENQPELSVASAAALPAENFTITEVRLSSNKAVTDAVIAPLVELTEVRVLFLNTTAISNDGLASLRNMTKLEELNLSGNSQLNDDAAPHLQKLVSLKQIVLNSVRITDSGLSKLSGLTNLTNLQIVGTNVAGNQMAQLAGMRNLTSINVGNSPFVDAGAASLRQFPELQQLDLSRTQVTDAGVAALKPLTKLTTINLRDTNTTDASLKVLEGLKLLHTVYASGNVTVAGLQSLRNALPAAKVAQ